MFQIWIRRPVCLARSRCSFLSDFSKFFFLHGCFWISFLWFVFVFIRMLQKATCLDSSAPDSGKGKCKSASITVSHGFHLVEGKSGHDMEDYHVAEYRHKKNHALGLFAIFDGHLGNSVPSYLKANLFNNILDQVPTLCLFLFLIF